MSAFRGGKKGKSSYNNRSHHPKNSASSYSEEQHSLPAQQMAKYEYEYEEGEPVSDADSDNEVGSTKREISIRVALWEFGQNDPKRDSGSKLFRLGYAQRIKVGQTFSGIVLSSEATSFLSPADTEIIAQHGVAGINCSWNRLEEIPFGSMGKSRHQRKLPLIFAANTVNYGKPYKMNTAEAIAAALYITGFIEDAKALLYPFSYGQEFLRLNAEVLTSYTKCRTQEDVLLIMNRYMSNIESQQKVKELKKEAERQERLQTANIGGYMDDMDLPPMESDDEYEDEDQDDLEEVDITKQKIVVEVNSLLKSTEEELVDNLQSVKLEN